MTNQGRSQFWFGLAIIFASVVGGICSLFGPAYGICAAGVVFVIVLAMAVCAASSRRKIERRQ